MDRQKIKLLKLLDTLINLEYSSLSNKTRNTMFTSNIITSSASSAITVESGSNPPVIKDAVRRVLENFEILYKTKFADLVLVSWVEILNNIPDADLIATGIRVAQTHKYLPTPNEFLEVYREGLRVKRDAERMAARQEILGNGDGAVHKPMPKTEESEKEYYIFRLAIALEYCNQLGDDGKKVHWKDYDMERLEIESKAFYASMRNMPLAELMDLNMQVRMPDKKGLVNNISHLLNKDL